MICLHRGNWNLMDRQLRNYFDEECMILIILAFQQIVQRH
jgi:hypothetical protein